VEWRKGHFDASPPGGAITIEDDRTTMANPYYNPGTNHTDYTQGHSMPQSPFQQSHSNPTGTTAQQQQQQQQQPHLPVYQQSPFTVHTLPPHPGYATGADHNVLQYTPTMHHSHTGRWVDSMETEDNMLTKYRQEDPEPDYEMDHHQSQDHPQQQQQQHMQSMQAPSVSHESQTHAALQQQQHPPIAAVSTQPEQMSPATRPGVIRTGMSSLT
jgi:hypothetical protein